jgi:hypothetical protein
MLQIVSDYRTIFPDCKKETSRKKYSDKTKKKLLFLIILTDNLILNLNLNFVHI